jgi:XTP/dITP diphosphohydrolase
MRTLLIATNNPGKIREIKSILCGLSIKIVTLNDIGVEINVEETGKTFEENAVLKAERVAFKTGYLTLAEDSGLEVDALNGRPGVYSVRYGKGTDHDRLLKLLEELKGIPFEKRTARYKAVVAIFDPEKKTVNTFNGATEGIITEKPLGENGFGYDSIFCSTELKKTFGQVTEREKNSASHRGKALKNALEFLKNYSNC